MPKRSAESPEESPRKLTRKTSKSPVKQSSKDRLAKDAALTNVSDDEEMGESTGKPTRGIDSNSIVPVGISLEAQQEQFFQQFILDITLDPSQVDVNNYQKMFNELPEEEDSEKKTLVDQHIRDFLISKVLKDRTKWNRFLELSIKLAREELCSASIPITLISDLVELSSLQDCEQIFEYVEDRLSVWKETLFLNSGKNAVLRMCNDLLRRLSRAQNTIFCGRILIFLANYFPFSERSGLNIMSEFNTDNITLYKSGDGSDDPEDKMEIERESDDKLFEGVDIAIPGLDKIVSITQEEKKKKVKVDYNLYVKFWSLQDFFRNPMQCYNKLAWKTFSMYIQDVLGAFTCFKIEVTQSTPKSDKVAQTRGHSSVNVIPKLGDEDLYFPKYLTNRRLLELQMGDPSFRRYFLVQLLIILQYLTTSVKFKTESQVLSDDQQEFVKKTGDKIYKLLGEIKPEGKEFAKATQHILKREELWSKWKNDGCQPFKKPVAATSTGVSVDSTSSKPANNDKDPEQPNTNIEDTVQVPVIQKKRFLGDILEEADANNKYLLGNSELTRLWNICGDNLEACRSRARDFTPSIDEFFIEAMKELDPEPTPPAVLADPSKREIKPKKIMGNSNFGWRSLRLLARKSPYFFQMISGSPIHPLQNYLEFILKKIAIDLEIPLATEEHVNGKIEEINGKKSKDQATNSNDASEIGTPNEGEQVVEGGADENDELLKSDKDDIVEEEEEGEVDKNVRNLTEEEQRSLGKALGSEWKKLALKLGFTKDEIEFFDSEKKSDAGIFMLRMWTENEKDDATVADLLYQLEGLKLSELAKSIFS